MNWTADDHSSLSDSHPPHFHDILDSQSKVIGNPAMRGRCSSRMLPTPSSLQWHLPTLCDPSAQHWPACVNPCKLACWLTSHVQTHPSVYCGSWPGSAPVHVRLTYVHHTLQHTKWDFHRSDHAGMIHLLVMSVSKRWTDSITSGSIAHV